MNIAVADRICYLLENPKSLSNKNIFYTVNNTYSLMNHDSTHLTNYLISYGKRTDTNLLLLINVSSALNSCFVIDYEIINYKESEFNEIFADTLFYQNPESFFLNFIKNVNSSAKLGITPLKNEFAKPITRLKEYGKARYYQLNNDFSKSEKIYKLLIKNSNNNNIFIIKNYISLLLDKSLQFKSNGKYYKAIHENIFKILKKLHLINNNEIQILLARLYIQSELWNFAESALSKAITNNGNNAEIYFYLSKLNPSRYKNFNFRNKFELLEKTVFLNPSFLMAQMKLGYLYLMKNDYRNAENVFRTILKINPISIDALLGLGKLYVQKNDLINIIKTYKIILQIDSENSDAYYNLGIIYFNDMKLSEAESFFKKAISYDNDHINSYFYLGVINAVNEKKDAALYFFRKRINLSKDVNDFYKKESQKAIKMLLANKKISIFKEKNDKKTK